MISVVNRMVEQFFFFFYQKCFSCEVINFVLEENKKINQKNAYAKKDEISYHTLMKKKNSRIFILHNLPELQHTAIFMCINK